MNTKVIILNAPKGAGKDTIADKLMELCPSWTHARFKTRLNKLCCVIAGIDPFDWDILCQRENKDKPCQHLPFGMSPRQFQIYVSEKVIKPTFGKDYFGKAAAGEVRGPVTVFSDGGFNEEIPPITDSYGVENLFVVKFTGQGVTEWGDDSRGWVTTPEGSHELKTTNDGTKLELAMEIINFLRESK